MRLKLSSGFLLEVRALWSHLWIYILPKRGLEFHALRHAYLMKEPTWNLSSYNRADGILVFLQINTDMLSLIL